jgi:hypothetical protein
LRGTVGRTGRPNSPARADDILAHLALEDNAEKRARPKNDREAHIFDPTAQRTPA